MLADPHLAIGLRRADAPASCAARVEAPGRLHLGFLDPSATLGRRFGSVGLVLEDLATVVELSRLAAGAEDSFAGLASGASESALARARGHLRALRRATGLDAPVHLTLRRALPVHAGLGSGTQLALAVGHAFSAAFGLGLSSTRLAMLLGRGARSGVGIAGFDAGGLLVDGGPRADGAPAAPVARLALPPAWRVVLVLDPRLQGLHGDAEKAAIAALPPLPRAVAADICHEVLMHVLAGAAGAEFEVFAAGVARIQGLLGRHFAAAQSGRAFASEAVGRLVGWLGEQAGAGIGQSSWGPTGFAIVASAEEARRALAAARSAGVIDPALEIHVVAARNRGGTIAATAAATAAAAAAAPAQAPGG
jgi:beta-RFAP synthase